MSASQPTSISVGIRLRCSCRSGWGWWGSRGRQQQAGHAVVDVVLTPRQHLYFSSTPSTVPEQPLTQSSLLVTEHSSSKAASDAQTSFNTSFFNLSPSTSIPANTHNCHIPSSRRKATRTRQFKPGFNEMKNAVITKAKI